MPPRCQLLSGSLPRPTRILRNPQPIPRTFATTSPVYGRKGGDLGSHLPEDVVPKDAKIPEYPHGPALLFKQSNRGLYGGQRIQFGNNVSPDTETKTRRHWKPNIVSKALYSVVLKRKIKLRVTSKVLKTMDREGGLDEYLLKESATRIKELGPLGWALRWTLMQQPEVIARFRAEAAALGLAQEVIDQQWPKKSPAIEQTRENARVRIRSEVTEARKQAQESARIAHKRESNYRRELVLQKWARSHLRKGVAPNKPFAREMAKDDKSRLNREIKWAGGEQVHLAWRKAKSTGAIDRAGGDEAWFAQHRADCILKAEERSKEAEREAAAREARQRQEAERRDEWGAVIGAKGASARQLSV